MKKFIRRIPAIVVMLGIFMLSALPGNDPFLNSLEFSDKIKHFIAYFVLGITFCFWITREKWYARPVFWGIVIVVLCTIFGIFDEFHQSFTPGRSGCDRSACDLGDIVADFFGGLASPIVYLAILWRVSKR